MTEKYTPKKKKQIHITWEIPKEPEEPDDEEVQEPRTARAPRIPGRQIRPAPPPAKSREPRGRRRQGPEVIATKLTDVHMKKGVIGKKPVLMGLLVVTIIIIAAIGLYNYILPRVDVEIITVYHEGTGGVSSSGFINVNTKISNVGTKAIENINITLIIIDDETGLQSAQVMESYYELNRGQDEEPKLEFSGDHYKPYNILLKVSFQAAGNYYDKEYTYEISENSAMNLFFNERISEWSF